MVGTALALLILAAPAAGQGTRTCAERAEPSAPDAARVTDPLRFFDAAARRLSAAQLAPRADGRYRSQKIPVDVAAGKVVTLTVAPSDRRRVALVFDPDVMYARGWFRIREAHRSVTFTSCPADEPMFSDDGVVGPRTGFPGGLVAAGPQCARFDVRVRGEQRVRRVRVPVGTRC